MAFNPSRLELARKRRGFSKALLSERSGLSLRTLGYYDSSEVTPSDEALETLSEVLKFPNSFFFGPTLSEIEIDRASFRSLSSMTASLRDSALAAGALAFELNRWLSERFVLPLPSIPSLNNSDPEMAAEQLRSEWDLGHKPIKNILHLVEAHGARCFTLPVDSIRVDAFSVWQGGVPLILLSPRKSGERGRMDVAHELGHLVMHGFNNARGRVSELEADRFGSAFLMPATDVMKHTPRNISLNSIMVLKRRWRVSAMAMTYRLRHLDLITEWQYRSFCVSLSKLGFRRSEPGGIPRESSQIIAKTIEGLRSEGISKSEIAKAISVSVTELNSLLGTLTLTTATSLNANVAIKPSPSSSRNRSVLRLVSNPSKDK